MKIIYRILFAPARLLSKVSKTLGKIYFNIVTIALTMLAWGAIPYLFAALIWIAFGPIPGIILFVVISIPLFLFAATGLLVVSSYIKAASGK